MVVKHKKAVLGYGKKIKTNTETLPGGRYMKYLMHSLKNGTLWLPVLRTMC